MDTEQDEVLSVDETSYDDSTTEGESETVAEETVERKSEGERKPETNEQRVSRLERQLEQARKKAGIKEKPAKESSKEEVADERYDRLELKTEGITAKKEQDIVLEYARFKGIDVVEAMKSPAVKAELAEYRAKSSVPAPTTSRTGNGASNSYEYWVAQAKKGNFPRHDKEMMQRLAKGRIFTS